MRYSKYKVSFPVVAGGDTVVFNQDYFIPNVKVPNYNEKTLPSLVKAYEKKTFFNEYGDSA